MRSLPRLPIFYSLVASALLASAQAVVPPLAAPAPGGTYFTLLHGASFETSGYLKLVLSRAGSGTVSVILGDEKPCVVGVGWNPIDGSFLTRPGGDVDMIIRLKIVTQPDGSPVVVGTVTDDGVEIPVEAPKLVATAASAERPVGKFTFVLGANTGLEAGCGAFQIASNGAVRGVVRVADGRARSLGGALSEDGTWSLYGAVQNGGAVSGEVIFGTNDTLSGSLHWRQEETATTAESDTPLNVVGGPYRGWSEFTPADAHGVVPVKITVNWEASQSFAAARLTKTGGLFWLNPLRVVPLKVDPSTGLVTGRISIPNGPAFTAYGAMLWQASQARGFLTGPTRGTFTILNAPEYASSGSSSSTTTTSGSVITVGAGTLNLIGSGTLTGNTTISGGTLTMNQATSITISSGTLSLTTALLPDAAVLRLSTGGLLNLGSASIDTVGQLYLDGIGQAAGTWGAIGSGATHESSLITGPGWLQVTNGAATTTTGGSINLGSGGLVKTGTGTLVLTGGSTFTGGTTINGGTLVIGGNTPVITGGTITGGTTVTGGNPPVITGGGTIIGGGTLNLNPGTVLNPGNAIITGTSGGTAVLNNNLGIQLPVGLWSALHYTSSAKETSLGGSQTMTDEAGNTLTLADLSDGQTILLNGQRCRVTIATPVGNGWDMTFTRLP